MGVQIRAKTEETVEPLVKNNYKEDMRAQTQLQQKREILWVTAIYLITWHILAVICTVHSWNKVKIMTIMWSK